MVYIHYFYNREIHISTGNGPFEKCFRYLWPSPLDIAYGQQGGVKEYLIGDHLRAENFRENIMYIHLQVKETHISGKRNIRLGMINIE